jgi:hypothetical protein
MSKKIVNTDGATMYVTLKSYLSNLEEQERLRPREVRRHVPNFAELAIDIGVTRAAVSYIASGDIKQLNLEIAGKIIAAMRGRGFQMEVSDFLAYRSPEKIET